VVDDDRVSRMLLTGSLERERHRVRCAEYGPEALELLHDDPRDVVCSTLSCLSSTASRNRAPAMSH